ncbi:head morphogenesis [Pantoea phage vB_PagM_LIET2]|uniref:Head morphogenesis protein n=1 Tax=Pantoea phage vB_PagM_LIET2 TaxID=2508071 RepID=A0A411AW32_9CAUD|nr:head morphogenesis [Pantoea phage vB_PagM_LIET2]QAX92280.1 head morphogenesis protein [Pantoea phage vB_PagM_LIET2]
MARFIPAQPRALEMQYFRDIDSIHTGMVQAVRQNIGLADALPRLRMDADPGEWSFVNAVVTTITAGKDRVISLLDTKFEQVSHFNWVQWAREVKAGTGHQLQEIRPWYEPGIDIQGRIWVRDNVSLITQMSGQMDAEFQRVVHDAVRRGLSKNQLKKDILDQIEGFGGVRGLSAEQRADLIATDQILKANSSLTNQRQQNAGVSYYRWQGMMDNRERHSHVLLQNHIFRVDGKPMTDADLKAVGNEWQTIRHPSESDSEASRPGTAVRCRCHSETVFKGSVFDFEGLDEE